MQDNGLIIDLALISVNRLNLGMKGGKKKKTPMEELTKNYDKFIKGKELNPEGQKLFDKTIKKAATKKQRGSK